MSSTQVSGLKEGVVKKRSALEGGGGLMKSQWAELALHIDGTPFKFMGRPYLRKIYDTFAPHIFMKAARGVEKSTWLGVDMIAHAGTFPFFRCLYVSASRQQAVDFSRDQLDQRLGSPWVRERLFDPDRCDNNVFLKSFTNGSKLRMRHVFATADRVRGVRSDWLAADEIQDHNQKFIPIVEEVLVQSPYALQRYAGTPKTLDNPAEYYWRRTTQEEWCVKCDHCWKWNDANSFGAGLGIDNIGKKGVICKYCGKSLNVLLGRWVAHGDGEGGRRLGYRVPQLIIPYYQDEERWQDQILSKLERYHVGQFYNEVLGYSYDEADKPVTEEEIKKCCRGPWIAQFGEVIPRVPVFAGVDWGSGGASKTVIVVGAFVGKQTFQVFFSHIFRPVEHPTMDDVLREIARICLDWNVVACGVDFGYGPMENMRLRPMIGDDVVWQFQNVNQQRADLMWNSKAGRFQHNYVQTLSQLFMAIKGGKLVFPRWERWAPFAEQMLNARKEYNWETGYVRYVNSPDRPDDTLHALNYAYMSARLYVHDWLQRDLVSAKGRKRAVEVPHFLRRRSRSPS